MRNLKPVYLIIGSCLLIFLLVITYWTLLPRHGTIDIPGEGIYTGQLRGHTFHGCGTYVSYELKGVSYEGEWKNGVYHGQGTLTFANGSQAIGQFNNGSLYGEGVTICPDGNESTVDFGEPVDTGGDCSCCN